MAYSCGGTVGASRTTRRPESSLGAVIIRIQVCKRIFLLIRKLSALKGLQK